MYENARSSDIPALEWRCFGWLDLDPGKTGVMEDHTFVTFSATKDERVVAKVCRGDGTPYHTKHKLKLASAMAGILTACVLFICLLIATGFTPGHKQVNVMKPFEPTAFNCGAAGFGKRESEACQTYLSSLPDHLETEVQQYWIGMPLVGIVSFIVFFAIACWFGATSGILLVRQLKVLHSDRREMRLIPDEDVQEMRLLQKVADEFTDALRRQVDAANVRLEIDQASDDIDLMRSVHQLSEAEFEAKAMELFVEPVDSDKIVKIFMSSITKIRSSTAPTIVDQACDTALSGFLINVESRVDGARDWLNKGCGLRLEAYRHMLTLADAHAEPLAKDLIEVIHSQRADASAARVGKRFITQHL